MSRSHASRRRFLASAAGGALALGPLSGARAQSDWPKGPIRFIVPYAAGGLNDIVMRLVSRQVADRIGQPIVIENRPGAGGVVGTNALAKSPADGYTIGSGATSTLIASPMTNPQSTVDVAKDIVFVSLLASAPMFLAVHPSLPVRSAGELAKYAKSQRGKLSYGSMAVGHFGHVLLMDISEAQDAAMAHSPYKGEAPLLQDLVGNQIQVALVTPPVVKPMAESGKLRLLGVTGTKRLRMFPDVPTLIEQGFDSPLYRMNAGWMGVIAPAGFPEAARQRLSTEYAAAVRSPEIHDKLLELGLDPIGGSAEDLAAIYTREKPVWRELLVKAGIELR